MSNINEINFIIEIILRISREDKYLHFDIKQIGLYRRHTLPFSLPTFFFLQFISYPFFAHKLHLLTTFGKPTDISYINLVHVVPGFVICKGMIQTWNLLQSINYEQMGRSSRYFSIKLLKSWQSLLIMVSFFKKTTS